MDGMEMDGMVIIGHRSSKKTFCDNHHQYQKQQIFSNDNDVKFPNYTMHLKETIFTHHVLDTIQLQLVVKLLKPANHLV